MRHDIPSSAAGIFCSLIPSSAVGVEGCRGVIEILVGILTASFWNIIIQWTSHDDLTEFFFLSFYNKSKRKNLSNDRNSKLHIAIWQKTASVEFCQLQINLEAKSMHGSFWKKDFIISKFALFFAGQVLFTVNGLLY